MAGTIYLTEAELNWLVFNCNRLLLDEDRHRKALLSAYLNEPTGAGYTPVPFRFSEEELYSLDDLFVTLDLKSAKLSDGVPLLTFVVKCWVLLTGTVQTDSEGGEYDNAVSTNEDADKGAADTEHGAASTV